MSRLPLVLAITLLAGFLEPVAAAGWDYKGQHGPKHWPNQCQGNSHQSPIDIDSNSIEDSHYERLAMINYKGYRNMTIVNNGHTVQLKVDNNPNVATIVAGGLNGIYELDQIHFHWPSEHTIHGTSYPLEVHFVHHHNKYNTMQAALKDEVGIAVIGVLFHKTNTTNPILNPLIDGIQTVSGKLQSSLRKSLLLEALLPNDRNTFYRYHGSLTTPGCDESVIWTVFAETIPISETQLERFHRVVSSTGQILDFNNRPLQEQSNRIVYFQSGPAPHFAWTNSGHRLHPAVIFTLIMAISSRFI